MPRSPRTLRVLVGTLPVEDGQVPPPVVGDLGHYWLIFDEAGHDEPDATVVTVQARAEPLRDGRPDRGGQLWDGTVRDDPPRWPVLLHGNGWSATWRAPRPVVGEVLLHGTLVADLSFGGRGGKVRGRVTRAQVVTETIDRTDPDQRRWRPIPELQSLREVQAGPRWFDHGLVAPPDAPLTGWFSPVPGDPYVREAGVLVDLDLDDVPPLPLRPSIVPGALSVGGDDLWVADVRLPVLVRLPLPGRSGGAGAQAPTGPDGWPGGEAVRIDWPGRILGVEEARGRRVHADADGCWVTGPDGVHRCVGTEVRTVLDEYVWQAAASGGDLAVQVNLDPGGPHARQALRLVRPSGETTDVVWPDGTSASSVAADGDGFLLRVSDPDGRPRVARVSRAGEYREGPPLPGARYDYGEVLGSGLVGSRGGLYRVRPDLGLDSGPALAGPVLQAWAAGPRILVATHVPDTPGRRLLVEPTGPRPDGRCWLLAELDPSDLSPVRSAYVPAIPEDLSVDGEWLLAAGVRRWERAGSGGPVPVDIAALIDRPG